MEFKDGEITLVFLEEKAGNITKNKGPWNKRPVGKALVTQKGGLGKLSPLEPMIKLSVGPVHNPPMRRQDWEQENPLGPSGQLAWLTQQ